MKTTALHFTWKGGIPSQRFRTAVSLHSHTLHSHEGMDAIVNIGRALPVVGDMVRRQENRYRRVHGHDFDPRRVWWTPPLTPRAAHELEAGAIATLGLDALVSLTDHDSIEAPLALRVLEETRSVPISVEWTVPWGQTFFHVGVHNLPPSKAVSMMKEMAALTAAPSPDRLTEILDWLVAHPAVLVILNHPHWDEKGIGSAAHQQELERLLAAVRPWIHALEANGLRPWSENRAVAQRSRDCGLPLISGGDRHGREPNAVLNLTNAGSFDEFAGEVRHDGWSDVYFTSHAAESRTVRIYREVCDILRDDPHHGLGWVRWSDRVFYQLESGEVRPVTSAWRQGPPPVVSWFVGLVRLLDHDRLAPALRTLGGFRRETVL